MNNLDARFQEAVQHFWQARTEQKKKQQEAGKIDTGNRGAVTGGTQMGALEVLTMELMIEAGLEKRAIKTRTALELPGYYRPEKKWDLIVVSNERLIAAIEFKSMVGSVSNNFNNRVEEAVGSATDIWTAFREGRFGSVRPFLGYFFLLEDTPGVHKPVKPKEPYFKIDTIFQDASYSKRFEVLCQRLILERLYDATCFTLATNTEPTRITHPVVELNFRQFAARLQGHARAIAQM